MQSADERRKNKNKPMVAAGDVKNKLGGRDLRVFLAI